MTTTEITVRAHKRKKPVKQPDPLQPAINARLAARQQRITAGQGNDYRHKTPNEIALARHIRSLRDYVAGLVGRV